MQSSRKAIRCRQMPFSSIHFSLKLSQSISALLHFPSSSPQLRSVKFILSFSFSNRSAFLPLCSSSSSSMAASLPLRKASSSSLFSMRVARAAFFLVKMSSLRRSSLISLSSFLMVQRRLLITSSFLPPLPNIRFFLISLSSRRSSSFSSRRIWFSFSSPFAGDCRFSTNVLFPRMLAVSFTSRVLCPPAWKESSWRPGEPLEWRRCLRVARMGEKGGGRELGEAWRGEREERGSQRRGERGSQRRGELARFSLGSFCSALLGFVVISELVQLLTGSDAIDSSSVVWICFPETPPSPRAVPSPGQALIFFSLASPGDCPCLARKPGAVLPPFSHYFLWKGSAGVKLFRIAAYFLWNYANIIRSPTSPSLTAAKLSFPASSSLFFLAKSRVKAAVGRTTFPLQYSRYLMALPIKYYRWLRNCLIAVVVAAPFAGYYYVSGNMQRMEKGITDDLKRIEMKGRTLADIPRKYE